MKNLGRYRKAIVAAVPGAVALLLVILRGDDPSEVEGLASSITLVLTTILVWAVPNES